MLNYTGSQMAASALIIAINQHNMTQYIKNIESEQDTSVYQKFFLSSSSDEFMGYKQIVKPLQFSVPFNTDIWNNLKVIRITGYTIEMLREPLHKLA